MTPRGTWEACLTTEAEPVFLRTRSRCIRLDARHMHAAVQNVKVGSISYPPCALSLSKGCSFFQPRMQVRCFDKLSTNGGRECFLLSLIRLGQLPLAWRHIAVAQHALARLQRLLDAVDPHAECRRVEFERVVRPDHHVAAPARAQRADLAAHADRLCRCRADRRERRVPVEAGGAGQSGQRYEVAGILLLAARLAGVI